jgi:AhpC/TSA family
VLRHRNEFPVEGELPMFDGATAWWNSAPLTPESLRGQVVLVSFGTYTCINWIRSLPYVRAWGDKYRGHGLAVIGVQTPEFEFEGDLDKVGRAIKEMDVRYPLIVDNDYAVWQAFENHYWPALYFVDAQGRIRHHHFGEGEYEASEMVLQLLLREAGTDVDQGLVRLEPHGVEAAADWDNLGSPETYLGTNAPTASHHRAPCRAGDTPTRHRPTCGATSGHSPATGRSTPCRRGSMNPAVPSRISSTPATCIS